MMFVGTIRLNHNLPLPTIRVRPNCYIIRFMIKVSTLCQHSSKNFVSYRSIIFEHIMNNEM